MVKLSYTRRIQLFLLALISLSYGYSIQNQYSLDDHFVTTEENLQVSRGFKGIPEILTAHYAEYSGERYGYRPFTEITFAIEYQIFGFNPNLSHAINLILFYVVVLLLFIISKELFPKYKWQIGLISSIYAVHPILSEVVLSLKNREELLAALMGLISLRLACSAIRSRKNTTYLLMLIVFTLGCYTKKTIYPFVFIIPLTLGYFYKAKWRECLKYGLSLATLTIILGEIPNLFLGEHFGRSLDFIENPMLNYSMWERLPTSLYVITLYYVKMIWPYPLLAYYGFDQVPILNYGNIKFFALAFTAAAYLCFVIYGLIKRKHWAFGFMISTIVLLPYSNLVVPIPGIFAERFSFIALWGFLIGIVFLCNPILQKIKSFKSSAIFYLIFIPIYIVAIFNCHHRTKNWKDLETLLKHDVEFAPRSVKLNTAMGETLQTRFFQITDLSQKAQMANKIKYHYQQSIALYPNNTGIYANLGTLQSVLGEFEQAQNSFEKSMQMGNTSADVYYNMGALHELKGNITVAKEWYSKALNKDPSHTNALNRLLLLN